MSNKHTPGPWYRSEDNHGRYVVVMAEPNKAVAVCYKQRQDPEANAKLIAAAPELLEVAIESLKELRACYKLLGIDEDGAGEMKTVKLSDAIKKATT